MHKTTRPQGKEKYKSIKLQDHIQGKNIKSNGLVCVQSASTRR